jgi:hypothetical protein
MKWANSYCGNVPPYECEEEIHRSQRTTSGWLDPSDPAPNFARAVHPRTPGKSTPDTRKIEANILLSVMVEGDPRFGRNSPGSHGAPALPRPGTSW